MANAHEAWHWIDFETYREAFIISGLNYIEYPEGVLRFYTRQ